MRVFFTRRAETQIEALYNFIAARSGELRADGFVGRIIRFCQGLTTFPQRGGRRDDLLPSLRVVGFERRVVIAFEVTDENILIKASSTAGRISRTLGGTNSA